MYDIRELISTLCDVDSVLEIRPKFGIGILTMLVRIEGIPMGLIANNPAHLAGAIDSPASDKAARFLQLCDAFELPVVSLMDCPGMMVGPEVEKTALVRHCARLFSIGSNITVPMFVFIVRKGYGLGAAGMAGGGYTKPNFVVAWPTGEFYGMNIEGSVKLAYRNEILAAGGPAEQLKYFNDRVEKAYDGARAVRGMAQMFGLDEVIDPADSRKWITAGLRSEADFEPAGWMNRKPRLEKKKYRYIDTW